jgi:hypothetical protein
MHTRRYLDRSMPRLGSIVRFRRTKFSSTDAERRRVFCAQYSAAFEVVQADPELWAKERAELEGTLMAPSRARKFSPAEIERRRVFAAEYNAAYEAMQADPELWAIELAERAELEGTLMDGLEEEY